MEVFLSVFIFVNMRVKDFVHSYHDGGKTKVTINYKKGVNYEGVSKELKKFAEEMAMYVGSDNVLVTSGKRGSSPSGNHSRHHSGEAIDLRDNAEVRKFLYSVEGRALLGKYGLGFLDETLSANLKKTNGTGAHFHVGKDSTLIGKHVRGNLNLGDYSYKDTEFVNPHTKQRFTKFSDFVKNANIQKHYHNNYTKDVVQLSSKEFNNYTNGITDPYNNLRRKGIISFVPTYNMAYNINKRNSDNGGIEEGIDSHNHKHEYNHLDYTPVDSSSTDLQYLNSMLGNLGGIATLQMSPEAQKKMEDELLLRSRMENEALRIEQQQKELEAKNKQLEQELISKQQERQQFLSMTPQANTIAFGNTQNNYNAYLQQGV